MTPKVDGPDHISPSLWPLVVPIDEVVPWKGNARRGNVPAVMKSLERFGQRKPVVAQRSTGAVSAGNHLLAAALKMGWTHIAVSWEDDDEATAEAFALADNNTHDVGFGNDAILLDQAILRITAVDPTLLEAAGFDVKLLDSEPLLGEPDAPHVKPPSSPVVSYTIIFDDEVQQKTWYDFIRSLRKKYPNMETGGERLAEFIATLGTDDALTP